MRDRLAAAITGGSVLLAACDTFRAAAIDQLRSWSDRLGLELVANKPGADAAAVAFDAVQAARGRGRDWVIIDTAGRLHTKDNLMVELAKIRALHLPTQVEAAVLGATICQLLAPRRRMRSDDQSYSSHPQPTLNKLRTKPERAPEREIP